MNGGKGGVVGKKNEYRKNAEAKFASPESNEGIGYYDEDGNQLSPEEFSRRVARDAERIRAGEAAGGPTSDERRI